jgi:hypothetical protein
MTLHLRRVPSACPFFPSTGAERCFAWSEHVPSGRPDLTFRSCPFDLSLFPLDGKNRTFSLVRACPLNLSLFPPSTLEHQIPAVPPNHTPVGGGGGQGNVRVLDLETRSR